MRKKTSTIVGLAIATILTAYISGLTLSNQVSAQAGGHGGWLYGHSSQLGQTNVKVLGQELTQGIKAQVGKVLGVQPQSEHGKFLQLVFEAVSETQLRHK
jgi:hypothetical protein